MPGDPLGDGDALGERDVGELQRRGGHVADRPDVRRPSCGAARRPSRSPVRPSMTPASSSPSALGDGPSADRRSGRSSAADRAFGCRRRPRRSPRRASSVSFGSVDTVRRRRRRSLVCGTHARPPSRRPRPRAARAGGAPRPASPRRRTTGRSRRTPARPRRRRSRSPTAGSRSSAERLVARDDASETLDAGQELRPRPGREDDVARPRSGGRRPRAAGPANSRGRAVHARRSPRLGRSPVTPLTSLSTIGRSNVERPRSSRASRRP